MKNKFFLALLGSFLIGGAVGYSTHVFIVRDSTVAYFKAQEAKSQKIKDDSNKRIDEFRQKTFQD
ncbi:MAG: hypothetical protein LBK71_12230 [Verrucomicrobiales bacterium]|jgi:hypothetical protein|nr:hypothetical protein [Verrucomicrobiales bacterium]